MDKSVISTVESALQNKIDVCVPVTTGHSQDQKYKIAVGGCYYNVRIVAAKDYHPDKYGLLQKAAKIERRLIAPTMIVPCGDTVILLSPWADGLDAETIFEHSDLTQQFHYGEVVGEIIHRLHRITLHEGIVSSTYIEYAHKALEEVCSLSQLDQIHHMLLEYRSSMTECALVHNDLRPANIIINDNSEVSIIDFETMSFFPPWFDLSFCLLFSKKYRVYGFGVVFGYFNNNPPIKFWQDQRCLVALQVARMVQGQGLNGVNEEKVASAISFITGKSKELMVSFDSVVKEMTR